MDLQNDVFSIVKKHLPGPFRPSGGSNILTKCPFHKGGEERKPSFSIDIGKGVYHCFTCHEAGTIFWLLKELGVPREQAEAETAIIKPILDRNREIHKIEREHTFGYRDPFAATSELPEAVLGIYDNEPPLAAQFDRKTMREMEVGFDPKLERVTYPLRDMYGKLAGISGGATRKDQLPKYDVYQGGRRDLNGRWIPGHFGKWFDEEYPGYKCENHDFLWNFNRIWQHLLAMSDPSATLILVEGFKACLWLLQHGYWATVALMGSYISERQQQMIHRFGGTVILMLDNDEPGRRAIGRVGDLLWGPLRGKVRVANYPMSDDQSQPDDYYSEALHHIIGSNIAFEQFIQQQVRRGEL